jgi:cytidylate kinase
MIIVLNGTAASGKGTLARLLARHLGLPHYDFGLIFRAVADLRKSYDWASVEKLIAAGQLSLENGHLFLQGVDIAGSLTSEEAGFAAAVLASNEGPKLIETAKRFIKHTAFVADGRTISAIFPQADRHFQVVADYETAQRRRLAQGGNPVVFQRRWSLDEARVERSDRAILIETSDQTPEQTLLVILSHL